MTMKFGEYTCNHFISEVASNAPAPGGGGVSALVGALGIALGNMVGQLTTGKKKYKEYEEDIQRLIKDAEKLQKDFLCLIDDDAEGFQPLSQAYGLPTDTEEQRMQKDKIMEDSLIKACKAPMAIMEKCCKAVDVIEEFAEKGSKLAISDAGAGAIICKSALQAASLNVFINTKLMKNRDAAEEYNKTAEEMLKIYTLKADEVYAMVYNQLKK